MQIALGEGIRAEVRPGRPLAHTPRWSLSGGMVTAGPYEDPHDSDRHSLETIGTSRYQESDEFRFSPDSKIVESICLFVPETNEELEAEYEAWQSADIEQGLLRLVSDPVSDVYPTTVRWFHPSGEALVSLSSAAAAPGRSARRVQVAGDLFLLTSEGWLQGWLLQQPIRYLSYIFDLPEPGAERSELAALVGEYVALIHNESLPALERRDQQLLRRLVTLYERTQALDLGNAGDVVASSIRDRIGWYYPEVQVQ